MRTLAFIALLALSSAVLAMGVSPPREETPLHRAAEYSSDPAVIKGLVAEGADVHAKTSQWGETPLHYAAAWNDEPAIIEALLVAGADVNARDDLGFTPLHRAASYSNEPSIIESLVVAGADVNARGDLGATPLHEAAENSKEPLIIEALVAAGADVNAGDGIGGSTPLHKAVYYSYSSSKKSIIEALLAAGADVTAKDKNGNIPLDRAPGNRPVARLLEDAMSAVGVEQLQQQGVVDGETPLHHAAQYSNDTAVIKGLIAAGADINAKDNDGLTPLHGAARRNREPSIVEALVAAGADVNAEKYNDAMTPLHLAAIHNKEPFVIEALLAAGADVVAKDRQGLIPLDVARHSQNKPVIRVLEDATPPVLPELEARRLLQQGNY